ncbi:Tat pathway signal protein [Mesorhizobium sp. M00.F.Ca.ET.216.01.1.1]|uniref:Acg family FMN-binding oxidoreductase n=1 Tax=Mesorhizobium sp. M00.F.Ca.ET.216.01.1.1 TaxID=2500528 RepID=UPI000FDB0B37|nr:Tat pathway signal protein [Mesorhizobium sp. M00.F.Ca.ET.216.01.1.1]TGQ32428.1 Tat pathway signal protein [Mesorhizobium sp. M00.F.Ca.ET.216.01.1.1]TJW15594.1 MAG: Tat pathway signal protein [Mesorhizobium sp.]
MNRRSLLIGAGGALLLAGAGTAAWTSSVGSMTAYDAYASRVRAGLTTAPDIRDLVRYATLAANSHNTQPWRFHASDSVIDILPDSSRRTPAVDPDDHHLFVSLGCAAENLSIAAAATGRPGEIEIDLDGNGARYVFSKGPARSDPLLAAIPRRQSTRAEYDGRTVPAAGLSRLELAAARPKVRLVLLIDRARIDRVRDLVIAGNSMQMADPAFMRELKRWVRFNPRSAMASGDGLFSAASGNPVLPTVLGDFVFDQFFRVGAENDRYARHLASSAGVAVFLAEREDKAHWIEVGRACQRFALTATSLGLKHAFINQPVEVTSLRPELAALVGENGRRPDIIMRLGYGPDLPFSPRRPAETVLA